MRVWVQLSIPIETANEVDLEDARLFPEWMRVALGSMITHPEAAFIKLTAFDDSTPTKPATTPPPGETTLGAPSTPIEQQVAGLLNELEF